METQMKKVMKKVEKKADKKIHDKHEKHLFDMPKPMKKMPTKKCK